MGCKLITSVHCGVCVLCHTQGSQGKVKESERLKDDGRLDVSITVCYQLEVTIGVYQMVEASEIQSRTETVATIWY